MAQSLLLTLLAPSFEGSLEGAMLLGLVVVCEVADLQV
jgi:hypothetical protein